MSVSRGFEIGLFTFGEITADPVTGRGSTRPSDCESSSSLPKLLTHPASTSSASVSTTDPTSHRHRAVHRRPGQGVRRLHRRLPMIFETRHEMFG
jgi:hypothetical protein